MNSRANEKLRIFLSLMTADNDYQREQALTAEETARTREIATLTTCLSYMAVLNRLSAQ
jgi:hypothetical protein